ncbi:MAG: aspartate aminotransferase family protein [Bacteroidetes bacterium]|nr:aspartate aminotransferase family protein [Bacteroidota bacterium]
MISNRQLFLHNVAQTSDAPLALEIEKAEGVYLYDTDGKSYIDLISGISVSNVGHSHPDVVKAVQEQAAKYMHTMVYGEYVICPQVELAGFLTSHLPEKLNNVYFVNSGAEATEGAMKLAKRFTGRPEIISCKNSYHGSTHGALSILGDEYFKRNYRPLLPDTALIEYNNFGDLDRITNRTAAVFMEVVQAEAGIINPETGYLEAVRKRCTETGTLLVFDEIQTGCGRTGKMFAHEQSGVVPDIMLLAKGLGGGMPIGAFISSKKIMSVIMDNPVLGHITTFGGHPVCCAAALATLKVIEGKKLPEGVAEKADLFYSMLCGHKAIIELRYSGLMMAIELKDFDSVQTVIKYCIENGVITDWFLFASNCVRIAPPLIITEDEINTACSVILEALDRLP